MDKAAHRLWLSALAAHDRERRAQAEGALAVSEAALAKARLRQARLEASGRELGNALNQARHDEPETGEAEPAPHSLDGE